MIEAARLLFFQWLLFPRKREHSSHLDNELENGRGEPHNSVIGCRS
jgi:hypothetical protein